MGTVEEKCGVWDRSWGRSLYREEKKTRCVSRKGLTAVRKTWELDSRGSCVGTTKRKVKKRWRESIWKEEGGEANERV